MNLLEQAFDLSENEEYTEALQCYDKVLSEDPKNVRALIDKGVTLQNLGRFKQSLTLYDKALKINPKNLDALINKGTALHSLHGNQKTLCESFFDDFEDLLCFQNLRGTGSILVYLHQLVVIPYYLGASRLLIF